MILQKLIGVLMIAVGIWFAKVTSSAVTREDGGAAVLFFIIGIALIVSKNKILIGRDD